MNEVELQDNVIIDDVGEVVKHIIYRLNLDDGQTIDFDKILDFIKTQDRIYYFLVAVRFLVDVLVFFVADVFLAAGFFITVFLEPVFFVDFFTVFTTGFFAAATRFFTSHV